MHGLRPWPLERSEPGPDLRLFRVRWDHRHNPRTEQPIRALVLETPDWCNVVARTEAGRFVLVRQFRFGVSRATLEIPGGMIDTGEDPLEAARRELLEETGYAAPRWSSLGSVAPNPAFHDNRCHHFLAEEATPIGPPQLDAGEDIEVLELDPLQLRAAIRSGEFDHALALTAVGRVLDLSGDPPPPPA